MRPGTENLGCDHCADAGFRQQLLGSRLGNHLCQLLTQLRNFFSSSSSSPRQRAQREHGRGHLNLVVGAAAQAQAALNQAFAVEAAESAAQRLGCVTTIALSCTSEWE